MSRDRTLFLRRTLVVLAGLVAASPASAAPGDRARIQGLSDVPFGLLANTTLDTRLSQSVCVFSDSVGSGYTVSASGSGAGGSFRLNSGASIMTYEVEWSQAPGQTSGTSLSPNTILAGLTSSASNQNCSPSGTSASLIVVIRALAAGSATAGSYGGTLTVIVGPN